MSQATDYVIANATGSGVRTDLNSVFSAIVTKNSGATEPGTTYSYMWWADTTTNKLKIRNGANTAWLIIGNLDATSFDLTDAFSNVTGAVTLTDTQLNNAVYLVSGIKMVFFEASAPAGWTLQTGTDYQDRALRVIDTTGGGVGGTTAFSSAFSHTHAHTLAVSSHVLTIAEMPNHQHFSYGNANASWEGGIMPDHVDHMGAAGGDDNDNYHYGTSWTGDGGGHTHDNTGTITSTTISPKYIDVIVCAKN